ncbi:hypothetical protein SNEBB_008750 [Seison nebaliae]|nr:hypothetical protein SNEBB_008750 [Seison nebaliae]
MTKIFGIEFAPLIIPWRRRLQTLCILYYVLCFVVVGFLATFVFLYLLFTKYYYVTLLYLLWLYYDWKKEEMGARYSFLTRHTNLWKHIVDYFPIDINLVEELNIDKHYIFACHPHGILCFAPFVHFATDATKFHKLYPKIPTHLVTLRCYFNFPLLREYMLSGGIISSTRNAINCVLKKKESIALIIGGARESLEANPKSTNLAIKHRTGFIRIAIENNVPIVPVFSFGENDVYKQISESENPFLRQIQLYLLKIFPFALPIFHGRGIFNYTFGIIPFRRPIHTVVGRPIKFESVKNPSKKIIKQFQEEYFIQLNELFESHKLQYGYDKEDHLTIC